jgi:hypothetical protein
VNLTGRLFPPLPPDGVPVGELGAVPDEATLRRGLPCGQLEGPKPKSSFATVPEVRLRKTGELPRVATVNGSRGRVKKIDWASSWFTEIGIESLNVVRIFA